MLSLNYNILNFSQVTDFSDFYRTQQKEVSKIHSIIDSIKMLLHVPGNAIKLFIAEGERVYKIIFYSNSLDRVPLGWFIYLPLENRIDLYDSTLSTEMPYIQWKNKKPVFKNFSGLLDSVHVERLFDGIIKVS